MTDTPQVEPAEGETPPRDYSDFGVDADDPENAIAATLDNAEQASRVMRTLADLGYLIIRKPHISQSAELLFLRRKVEETEAERDLLAGRLTMAQNDIETFWKRKVEEQRRALEIAQSALATEAEAACRRALAGDKP